MQKCSFWNGWWMYIRNLEQTNGGIRSPFWCILVNDTMGFQKTAFTEYFLSGKDILGLLFCFTMLMSNWQDGFIFITSLAVRAFLAISQTGCVYFKIWWLTSPAHRIKLCWSWYSLHSCSHSSHCHHMHTTGPRACGLSPADPPSSYLQFFPLKTLKKVTKCCPCIPWAAAPTAQGDPESFSWWPLWWIPHWYSPGKGPGKVVDPPEPLIYVPACLCVPVLCCACADVPLMSSQPLW